MYDLNSLKCFIGFFSGKLKGQTHSLVCREGKVMEEEGLPLSLLEHWIMF